MTIAERSKRYRQSHLEQRRKSCRNWYRSHREQEISRSKRYRESHAEKIKEWRRKRYLKNKESELAAARKWQAEHPEETKASRKKSTRKMSGAINPTGESKFGLCEICSTETKLYFDHNHVNGLHRGWICGKCNSGLGFFKDSPVLLLSAAKYLQEKP